MNWIAAPVLNDAADERTGQNLDAIVVEAVSSLHFITEDEVPLAHAIQGGTTGQRAGGGGRGRHRDIAADG